MENTVPNGSGFAKEIITEGLERPISFAMTPDGRVLVNEQGGTIKVIEDGEIVDTMLDISDEVNSFRDRGLMGITLDPNFENNGFVYLQYTVELDPDNPDAPVFSSAAGGALVRYTISDTDPNKIDPASKIVILDGHEMSDATHTVGDLDFDNDGNLLFSWGDGGFDPVLKNKVQDINEVQGKMFRIDPVTFEGVADNPFYDEVNPDSVASKVLAYGIRNTWKFSVDRETGDIYMGDVTDLGPEEVNIIRADGSNNPNFGWPYFEGSNPTSYGTNPGETPLPADFTYEPAFIELEHVLNTGAGDAIFGGLIYTGDVYDEAYQGRYFFANTSQGNVYTADTDGNFQQFGETGDYAWTVDLQQGADGYLYGLSLFNSTFSGGEFFRLVSDGVGGNNAPDAVVSASQTADEAAFTATLDASDSTDPDGDNLVYSWDFESDGAIDATGAVATHLFDQPGRTTATLTVDDGNGNVVTEVLEFDIGPDGATGVNLAYGKQTEQVGTANGGLASRVVDGIADGDFANGSVSETNAARSPHWEVDLGAIENIGDIEIYPRTDAGDPLNNFFVLVSSNPFSSNNLAAVRTDPGITEFHVTEAVDGSLSIPANLAGRFVRVQLEDLDASLSLAEVRVLEGTGIGDNLVQDVAGTTEYLTGTTDNDVFVIDGSINDFTVGPTEDGTGHVVYSATTHDILTDFEEIRFNDGAVSLNENDSGNFVDNPNVTQFLTGSTDPAITDTFVINGLSSDYSYGPTESGDGIVVYNATGHDILTGFEVLSFTDQTIDLTAPPTGDVSDVVGVVQYLNGIGDADNFIIDGLSTDYNIAPTRDGLGTVVWTDSGHDILYDFETITFTDTVVDLTGPPPSTFVDDPDETQYIFGTFAEEKFVVAGRSTEYNWNLTADGGGYVVYNDTGHDLLYQIDKIEFDDQTVELEDVL